MAGKEHEMNISRGRPSSRTRRSSGEGPAQGKKRTVDIDEDGIYPTLSIKISQRLNTRLGHAMVMAKKNKTEFVIDCLEPVIDAIIGDRDMGD